MMRLLRRLSCLLLVLGIQCLWLDAKDLATESFSERPEIEKRLAAASAELKELPDGAEPALRERLEQLAASCQYHLAAVDLLTASRNAYAKTKEAVSAWQGFPQQAPYSLLLRDEIRESLAVLENSQRTSAALCRMFEAEVEELGDQLSSHQQAERRAEEVAKQATDPESKHDTEHTLKMENLSARLIAEKIGRRQMRVSNERVALDTIAAKQDRATRQLKSITGKLVLPRAELDALQQHLDRERAEAAKTLVEQSKNGRNPDPLLTWRIEFIDLQKNFWDTRSAAVNSDEPATVRASVATLKGLQRRVDDWVKITELRLAGDDAETVNADPALVREAVRQVRAMQRRIGFAIGELDAWQSIRGTPVLDRIRVTLQAFWNAELYLVEESDIVDGRKIAVYRPVTTGKLVRLAGFLGVGWWILRFISRRVRATVARRGKIPEATAELAGKWAFGTGLFLLAIYGLHAVSIPLTAFAFLGGALAIGVGFGTQTLLKNFISGIILLFERPLRVGDVVEVAGITGTIKRIGVRASLIQHFDGIETLIPNSTLLENQLTNWTFSNSVVRHSVLVGVAYGSPTREVSRLLLAVAKEHGLVEDDPAPEVRLDNFADNSLTFSLLFWLDTKKTGRGTLASDLRYMIDKAFSEAGVAISFPQRDLHFDAATPLRVELSRSPITATRS